MGDLPEISRRRMASGMGLRAFFKMDQLSATLNKGRAADVIPSIVSHFTSVPWASAPAQLWAGYVGHYAASGSVQPLYHMIALIGIGGVYREAAHLDHEVHELHHALETGMPLKKDPFNQYPQGSPERRAFERHAHH